jgi:hypothetical protein
VVTLYLLLLVPVLIALFSLMAFAAPRVFATAWDAFGVTWQRAHEAINRREAITSLVSLIQLVVLGLSPVGLALTLAGAARRISGTVWGWTEMRPRARAGLVVASAATVTALFVNWWMNGAYRPIAVGERGALSARAFDIREAVAGESQERSVPPERHPARSKPVSVPRHVRAEPSILRRHPGTQRARTTGSGAAAPQMNAWMVGDGATSTSHDSAATEPSSGTEWAPSDGTTTQTTTETPTDTTPPSTTTPGSTSTTTATTTTP